MEENQFCLVWANRIISTIYLWGEFSRRFLGQGYDNIVSLHKFNILTDPFDL